MIIYTLNFLDRQVINILAEAIKTDLQSSRLAAWPHARLSLCDLLYDPLNPHRSLSRVPEQAKDHRRCRGGVDPFHSSFGSCAEFRTFGVGFGEAGCMSAAHALITDYVPKEKRVGALAFYSIAPPGHLGRHVGWQADCGRIRLASGIHARRCAGRFALIAAFTLVDRASSWPRITPPGFSGSALFKSSGLCAPGRHFGWWLSPPRSRRSSASGPRSPRSG